MMARQFWFEMTINSFRICLAELRMSAKRLFIVFYWLGITVENLTFFIIGKKR